MQAATIWVAIDDSNAGNGALEVIPGSHLLPQGSVPHVYVADDAALPVGVSKEALATLPAPATVALSAGQISIHHAMVAHGSKPNLSNDRRAGVAFHYMAASAHFNRDNLKPGKAEL
jgi:ectoine hydroxylase-related dioxygenase (phytanoyl-CoA dioxygenase family)